MHKGTNIDFFFFLNTHIEAAIHAFHTGKGIVIQLLHIQWIQYYVYHFGLKYWVLFIYKNSGN